MSYVLCYAPENYFCVWSVLSYVPNLFKDDLVDNLLFRMDDLILVRSEFSWWIYNASIKTFLLFHRLWFQCNFDLKCVIFHLWQFLVLFIEKHVKFLLFYVIPCNSAFAFNVWWVLFFFKCFELWWMMSMFNFEICAVIFIWFCLCFLLGKHIFGIFYPMRWRICLS